MQNNVIERTFESAWTRSQLEMRYLALSPQSVHRFQELLSHMLYPNPRLRPTSERLLRNELNQRGLWGLGVSGDLPILTVIVPDDRAIVLVREVLTAHTYWRLQGFRTDLVILNQEPAAYDRPLWGMLVQAVQAHTLHTGIDTPGGVFLRDWHSLSDQQRSLLMAASHAVLSGTRGRLGRQLSALAGPVNPVRQAPAVTTVETLFEESSLPFLELDYFNGLGGFSRTDREYCIYLDKEKTTPQPWVNVIAGPSFGTIVSDSGLGHTWAGNSQANRLTPWRNDPVGDGPSEAIYIRDDESGRHWSPTALPCRTPDPYRARHGMGYSVFEHNHAGLEQELTVFIPNANMRFDPVKISLLRISNRSARPRTVSIYFYAEWVLGTNREESQMHVSSSMDEGTGALLARNVWSQNYGGQVAFACLFPRAQSYTADRTAFLGRNGSYRSPLGLSQGQLDRRTGAGMDPCAVLKTTVVIPPRETRSFHVLLGQAANRDDIAALIERFSDTVRVEQALAATKDSWQSRLSRIQVKTPVLSVNLLMNGWLMYQSLSCRFWGRSGYYQSGGAFGFRDQLQDAMGLVYFAPQLTREHILRCATRQYPEGDVQHWWHPESGMGVRTKCSDDLLWLPYVTLHYVTATGDTGILDERVPFLNGPLLEDGEQENLHEAQPGFDTATLLEHCLLAIKKGDTAGPHGLPLMGNGDWNDGMNLVGHDGKGESVWLAWFLITILRDFSALLRRIGRTGEAAALETRKSMLLATTEKECWDGEWYLRAFFDDGSPLGSRNNPEAQIDSIAQSWAVMAGAGATRAKTAVQSAITKLVDPELGLVHLFWPPFDKAEPHPGYIRGYPPGLRENGGQYTHGSLWLAMACAKLGDGNEAARLLQMMNPIERTRGPEAVERYRTEPYVVAADVYAAPGQEGRSGWTWYTGSAAWMYRIWLEEVLGFRLQGDTVSFVPALPEGWEEFSLSYLHGEGRYEFTVRRGKNARRMIVDGSPMEGPSLRLSRNPGRHQVEIEY